MTDKVLIIDGSLPSGLSAVRSLSSHGLLVDVLPTRRFSFASNSKYVHKCFEPIDPSKDKISFQKKLIDLTRRNNYALILSFSDSAFLSLFSVRSKLPKNIQSNLPPKKSVEVVFDKLKTIKLCKSLGIPIPKTYLNKKKIEKFPLVIKSRRPGRKKIKTLFVTSKDEFEKIKKKYDKKSFILQEYIAGGEYGAFFLVDNGKILASFAHKRILSFDPYGGASTVRVSIPIPIAMYQNSKKILEKLRWSGVIMIEFKENKKDKKFNLIEINGRYWGSLPLAISSGIDFPYLDYLRVKKMKKLLVKETSKGYKKMYQKNFIGLVESIPKYLHDKKQPYIEKNSFLKLIFLIFFPMKDDVFSFRDLNPFIQRIKFWFRRK